MSGATDRREEEHVPQFYGRIDEKFTEWETDVKLWQVKYKEDDRVRLGSSMYRRGLHGQPKILVKTKLGTQDVSQNTVDNIIQCLRDNGYGELPEELGQEASDNYFDTRHGKAESILDHIFREVILTVALKKDIAIDLDEKIRGYQLMRTSNLTEREISGIKIITQAQTQLAQVKKVITQTIVAKRREEVRDDLREAGDRARDRPGGHAEAPNFHLEGDSDDDQEDRISESESNCSEQWYESDGQEPEALISLRDARKKLQHATKSRRFYPTGGGRSRSTGKSIDELKKVTPCNRCGAIGHWEEDCTQPARSRKKRSPPQKAKEKVVGAGEENLMVRDEVRQTTPLWRSTTMVRRLNRHISRFLLDMRFGIVVLPRVCVERNLLMAQTCAREGKRVGDERDAGATDESYHFRGIGNQIVSSFMKLRVPGSI